MGFGRLATGLGAAGVLGIGTLAWFFPRRATATYGVPLDGDAALAYVRGCAARDWVMGGMVLWAAVANDVPAMKSGLALCSIAPLADALLVLKERGPVPQLIIHTSGVIGIILAFGILSTEEP